MIGVPALAGSQAGQITKLIVRASDGLIYFFLDGTPTGRPTCADAPYWMIKNENSNVGKQQLATLLAARAAGQPVAVTGTGACTRWSNGEDVDSITY
ncbi:hypothetical protein H9L41_10415 [Chitinimonas koreensis]|nr:hypothetical protein H9L41_10415 [Chitinimonas koreensis]